MNSVVSTAIAKSVGVAFVIGEIVLVTYLTNKSSTWFQPKATAIEAAPAAQTA